MLTLLNISNFVELHRKVLNMLQNMIITMIGTSPITCKCTCWTSCRCSWTSRKTKNNHRFPNTHDTCSSFVWRESRISNRGIPSCNANHGRVCDSQEKPRLLDIFRKDLFPVNVYCTVQVIQD